MCFSLENHTVACYQKHLNIGEICFSFTQCISLSLFVLLLEYIAIHKFSFKQYCLDVSTQILFLKIYSLITDMLPK